MYFKDLSSRAPPPATDMAKTAPVTAKPGKTPEEGAPFVHRRRAWLPQNLHQNA